MRHRLTWRSCVAKARAYLMLRILIIQAQMKHYRVPFFTRLHQELLSDGIDLHVAYSSPPLSEAAKGDNSHLPRTFSSEVPAIWAFRERIVYQPLLAQIARADLVIVEHANKHILNHLLILSRTLRIKRFALWGLGSNKQMDRSRVSEWYKRMTIRQTDWYFAYTTSVASEVAQHGIPAERITAVQNAVDTSELRAQIASCTHAEVDELRSRCGIDRDAPVGIFCGMLEPVKGVPFLIESAKRVRSQIPEFHLFLVGGGRHLSDVERMAAQTSWIHVVGPKFGREKALLLKAADIFLLPGRVGLAILDCFAAQLPLLTVRLAIHGPEIEYLQQGVNGFMVEPDEATYASTVVRILRDPSLLQRMRDGAAHSAGKYSVESMVANFRSGIIKCLSADCARRKIGQSSCDNEKAS